MNGLGTQYENVDAIVSGWGTLSSGGSLSSTLLDATVTTMSNSQCKTSYGTTSITNNMICAAAAGKDSCQGDSGGPLIRKATNSAYILIGIVSWGFGCAQPDYPGVYARVSNQLDWIKSKMAGATCSP